MKGQPSRYHTTVVLPQKVDLTGPFDPEKEELHPKLVKEGTERRFGPYILLYQIACGGMGTVYLGRFDDPSGFSSPVAIKRIHENLAQERKFVEMFFDEAFIASKIKHPNVCAITDVGQVDQVLYMAMEYLAGVPLARLSRAVSLDATLHRSLMWQVLAARIAADAADGLHSAHELTDDNGVNLGTVHRDVSPQNVFITFDGHVKLLDFGIVFAKKRFHHTERKTLKGKVSYMAPEQIRGRYIDRRADVWSLGVCLWEMLAGRRLFKETESLQTLDALLDKNLRVPPPSQYCPTVPPVLDAIALRALARPRIDRFPTTASMGEELRKFVAAADPPAGPGELAALLVQLFSVLHSEKNDIIKTILSTSDDNEQGSETSPRSASPSHQAPEPEEVEVLVAKATTQDQISTLPEIGRPENEANQWPVGPAGERAGELSDVKTKPAIEARRASLGDILRGRRALFLVLGLLFVFGFGFLVAVMVMEGQRLVDPEPTPDIRTTDASSIDDLIDRHVVSPPAQTEDPSKTGENDPPPLLDQPTTTAPLNSPAPEVLSKAIEESLTKGVPLPRTDGGVEGNAVEDDGFVPRARPAPRRNTPPSRPRTTARGQVNVVALGGWADVFEGGRSLGRTPRQISLPSGRHVLTLRPFGRTPIKRVVVNVQPNKTVRVVVPVGE